MPRPRLRATGTCRVITTTVARLKGGKLRPEEMTRLVTCRLEWQRKELAVVLFHQLPGLGISFR